jgi:hypothetical protein
MKAPRNFGIISCKCNVVSTRTSKNYTQNIAYINGLSNRIIIINLNSADVLTVLLDSKHHTFFPEFSLINAATQTVVQFKFYLFFFADQLWLIWIIYHHGLRYEREDDLKIRL